MSVCEPPLIGKTSSKIEFDGHLQEARIGGAHNPPEGRAADVPAHGGGAIKLRMVGHIKRLHAELQRFRLGEVEGLQKGKVGIGDAGAVEKAPRRRAHLAERGKAEQRRVKGGPAVSRVGVDFHVAGGNVGSVHAIVVDPVGYGPQQRGVVVVVKSHGEAGAESRDSREAPPLRQPVPAIKETVDGQFVFVTRHEIVAHIERRYGLAQVGIDGVHRLGQAG